MRKTEDPLFIVQGKKRQRCCFLCTENEYAEAIADMNLENEAVLRNSQSKKKKKIECFNTLSLLESSNSSYAVLQETYFLFLTITTSVSLLNILCALF